MYIEADGKIYTFYDHAVTRMRQRDIAFEWVETTLQDPDDLVKLTSNRMAYDKTFLENRIVRVVVDEELQQIVTVYYVDEA